MKLALKVVLAAVAGILVVLVLFGYARVQREVALFDSDMRNDHRLIGSTLALGVRDLWDEDGEARALQLIALADADQSGLLIAWVYPGGERTEPARAAVDPTAARALALTHHLAAGLGNGDEEYLVTYVPVRSNTDALLGSIEITETLAPRDTYIRTSMTNTALATGALGVVAAAVVLCLGIWLIGRPLNQLAAKARRVGEGDLSGPLLLRQRDEIGELAKEMNAMCEQLAAANSRAASETAARIHTLEQLRHADRLITVGKLAAGIAHELGTPLNVVSGRAKMIQRGKAAPEVMRDYARIIAEQAERMAAIIRQLLDFTRRREPRTAVVELANLVHSTARLLEPMAQKKNVTIHTQTEAVTVRGNAGQLEQVVTNLLVNALHASADGGSVFIATGREDLEQAGLHAFLRVRDYGHGMDAATASHVFEPFFTTKAVGQGAGLGLSVAHGIVEDHGGCIQVQSLPNEGATFTVYLPLEQA